MAQASERWSPPAGFVRLDSQLRGVVVYGPAPVGSGGAAADGAGGPRATKCGSCGAPARFEVAKQALTCSFCGWVGARVADAARPESAGEFTSASLAAGEQGFGVDRRELACSSCGSTVALDDGALAVTCPFCASEHVDIREHAASSGIRPSGLAPFRVAERDLSAKVRAWLSAGWMHPKGLAEFASVDKFSGIYLPYWVFDARLESKWRAEVGTARTVRTHHNGRTQTRTVIDYRWREGRVSHAAQQLVAGTSRVEPGLLARVAPFDLGAVVAYTPDLLAGWQASAYNVGLSDAWEVGRREMRDATRRACLSDAASPHVRNLSITTDFGEESWRHLLLPVYLTAYRFGERSYVVAVNGQTGVVVGQKPVLWLRVYLAMAACVAPGLCVGAVGVALALFGIGIPVAAVGLFLLVVGMVGAAFIGKSASSSEQL